MPSEIIEFPFDSGAYEAADREWLPPSLFAVVENLRLDLDGRLGVRPGFTALGTTTYSPSALVAYDLTNFSGRLVCLGDQTNNGRPTDLFEFVNNKAVWRGTGGADDGFITGFRMPRATNAREVGQVPDLSSDVFYTSVATGSNLVCAVSVLQSQDTRIHIFDPRTDQTILLTTKAHNLCKVVFAGTKFWIIGQNTSNLDIEAFSFDPSTDESLSGSVTLIALAASVNDLAAAQTGASDFTIAYCTNTNVEAARFNSSGVSQATFTVQTLGTSFTAVACCGNTAGTLLSFAFFDFNTVHKLKTTNQNGGGAVGPTTLFGGATETAGWSRLAMRQEPFANNISICGQVTGANTENVATQLCTNQATNTLATTITLADAILAAQPCPVVAANNPNFYYGVVDNLAHAKGTPTNLLIEQALRVPQTFKDATIAGAQNLSVNAVGSSALIGSKLYWGNTARSVTAASVDQTIPSGNSMRVTELEMNDTGRRPMSQIANELHIAGAMPMVYDGRYLVEQGFAERPAVTLTQQAGGSLTALGVYKVRTTWEVVDARGNILRSQASNVETITLTGANGTINVLASTPHSLRVHPILNTDAGYSIRLGVYRTVAGGANFFLDHYSTLAAAQFGTPTADFVLSTDASVRANAVLYEQSQTPVPHVSPPPYRYSWPARERLMVGALPQAEQWMTSKLLFPSEPLEFANTGRLGFGSRANQDVTGVAAFETTEVVFTKSEISVIPGRGPEHNGTGEFDSAIRVRSPGGLADWRSLVDSPLGIFFQMQTDKLMLLKPSQNGLGDVVWVGQPVRQTLALFPVITGAVHVRSQMIVAFSCTDTAGTAGRLLIYDLRRDVWYVDTIGPVVAVSELDGRLALVQSGLVLLQDLAAGSGTFIPSAVQTGMLAVRKRLGWGHIYRVGLLGVDMGACSVQCLIDYDDSVGFRDLGTEAFTGTGQAFERFWSLSIQKTTRFALRWVITSASSSSLGVRLNAWAAEVQGSPNMVRVGSGGVVR